MCYLYIVPRGGRRPGAGRKRKPPVIGGFRRCPTCNDGKGARLPSSDFYRDSSNKTGLHGLCKTCTKANRRARYVLGSENERDRYHVLKFSARKRGHRVLLSFEDFCRLRQLPCAYGGGVRPAVRIGIDRKDSQIGYTLNNCVPCCSRHNEIKRHFFSYKEMLLIVQQIPRMAACGNKK